MQHQQNIIASRHVLRPVSSAPWNILAYIEIEYRRARSIHSGSGARRTDPPYLQGEFSTTAQWLRENRIRNHHQYRAGMETQLVGRCTAKKYACGNSGRTLLPISVLRHVWPPSWKVVLVELPCQRATTSSRVWPTGRLKLDSPSWLPGEKSLSGCQNAGLKWLKFFFAGYSFESPFCQSFN